MDFFEDMFAMIKTSVFLNQPGKIHPQKSRGENFQKDLNFLKFCLMVARRCSVKRSP